MLELKQAGSPPEVLDLAKPKPNDQSSLPTMLWRGRILISNFHDCFLSQPFEHGSQFLMYGRPTTTKGQEKSEEGNSPSHPGSSF